MPFDPNIHHRHSIRLKGYDYSQVGAYFVTIVAYQRECLFGEIVDGEMKLNGYGKIVQHAWFDLPRHYHHVDLGAFVIMPNHVHAIIILNGRGGSISGNGIQPNMTADSEIVSSQNAKTRPYIIKRHALPEIVRAFKSFSAKRINVLRHMQGISVWQRNYVSHVFCGITNILFVTNTKWKTSGNTLKRIRPCGMRMMKTRRAPNCRGDVREARKAPSPLHQRKPVESAAAERAGSYLSCAYEVLMMSLG